VGFTAVSGRQQDRSLRKWRYCGCLSDGHHDLLQIAERSGETFTDIRKAAQALLQSGLLEEANGKTLTG